MTAVKEVGARRCRSSSASREPTSIEGKKILAESGLAITARRRPSADGRQESSGGWRRERPDGDPGATKNTKLIVQGMTGRTGAVPRPALDGRVRNARSSPASTPGQEGREGRRARWAFRYSTPCEEAVERDRRQCHGRVRAAAIRRRRDHGGCRLPGIPTSPSSRSRRAFPTRDMICASKNACWRRTFPNTRPGRPKLPRRHHPGASASIGIMPALHPRPRAMSAWFRARARSPTRRSTSSPGGTRPVDVAIGIGGDPVNRHDFVDCLELFEDDPETEGRGHDR